MRSWNAIRNRSQQMRQSLLSALILSTACMGTPAATPESEQQQLAEMKTIETVDPRPAVIDPPLLLQDEAAPPKPLGQPWEPPRPVELTPEDEALRASLPFTPAIAMDPVAGSKISITAKTPIFEFKGRLYYFESEENKRAFTANPSSFLTGKFTRL